MLLHLTKTLVEDRIQVPLKVSHFTSLSLPDNQNYLEWGSGLEMTLHKYPEDDKYRRYQYFTELFGFENANSFILISLKL